MDNNLKGKFVDMSETSMFVRNGLHSPPLEEESVPEAPKKEEELSSAWKVLKAVLFVLCLAIFVHQTIGLCSMYRAYPTTATTTATTPPRFEAPALTLCSDNPVKRSEFCEDNSGLCKGAIQAKSCENLKDPIPDFGYCTEDREGHNREEFWKVLCTRENFKNGDSTKYCREDRESLAWTVSRNRNETVAFVEDPEWKTLLTCLSTRLRLTSGEGSDDWPMESQANGSVVDSFQIIVDRSESFYPWKETSVFLSIHSPFVPSNPLLEGIHLKTGHSYLISIRLEKEYLLADPYQTHCTDYEGEWLKNNKSGPRSQEMCRDVCQWFNSEDAPVRMVLPEYASDFVKEKYGRWNSTDKCMENCTEDCVKLKYSYSVFERISGAVNGRLPLEDGEISVQILIADPKVSVTTHVPLYDVSYLMSRVGGILAIWLGISVWSLVGWLEKAVLKIIVWMQ